MGWQSIRTMSSFYPISCADFGNWRRTLKGIDRSIWASRFLLLILSVLPFATGIAQVKRVVVVKIDGLPADLVDRFVQERDPRTGKSQLPWFDQVFYRNGTRVANFYVRGMSLSVPSWSLLDTGQHLNIRGNVEFDRYTLHSYDYLNFIPFYLNNALERRIDMPGAEVLDEIGVPLLIDAFGNDERYQSFQLLQRAVRWTTLQNGLKNRVAGLGPREFLDEWTTGFDTRSIVAHQLERELIERLNNPHIRYLDLYTSEFDHAAHHNRDRETHLRSLKDLDATIGRIWTAIQNSKEAAETAMVVVSDHGFNSDEKTYSQGFNLVKLLGSREGGGHHVITKRRLMLDYSIKGVNPLVPLITTTTDGTYYLKGQSTDYPTALFDFDGNERAAIQLRDSDLNLLHILFQQLQRKDLDESVRRAATATFFATIDRRRPEWKRNAEGLSEELEALRRFIAAQQALVASQPKKWTKEEEQAGKAREARRVRAHLNLAIDQEKEYSGYLLTLKNLLQLGPDRFRPQELLIPNYIAKGAMGEQNSIHQLQNYIVGLSDKGLTLRDDGALDLESSFKTINYFRFLRSRTVRNNVQGGVGNEPIDFVARSIPAKAVQDLFPGQSIQFGDAVWIYSSDEQQALILSSSQTNGALSLRYLPVENLAQSATGEITFKESTWHAGFPLHIWEDPSLNCGGPSPSEWLGRWHTDVEWLRALHKTTYSNGFVGLNEQMAHHFGQAVPDLEKGLNGDEAIMRRFRARQRQLVESDLLILANNHWNFDVRGFNPGGNHGSFFRISTHATLMFAGGEKSRIPRGVAIEEPYDSLSVVPTVFAMLGSLKDDNFPGPQLYDKGFRQFPGRVISEVLGGLDRKRRDSTFAKGSSNSDQ
jgi:hypothetical protein